MTTPSTAPKAKTPSTIQIPGRSVVVSLILSPAALAIIDERRGTTRFGDALEGLIAQYIDRVKLPKTEIAIDRASGRPKRIDGRTKQRNVRLSQATLAKLDAYCDTKNAIRSEAVEALIGQFGTRIKGGK